MWMRSCSAATVRSRPNQRTLSTARAAGSARPSATRKFPGQAVQRQQQVVGLGELAHAGQGERVPLLDLGEDALCVARDEGDEEQLDGPLRGHAPAGRRMMALDQCEWEGDSERGGERG